MSGTLREGTGRLEVRLHWLRAGGDWVILIEGGERPHIGAAALAWESGEGIEIRMACLPRHREDGIVRRCAELCSRKLHATVQIACGIHVDRASPEEIQILTRRADSLIEQLLALAVEQAGPAPPSPSA
jgi:hypothetical protein